VQQLWQRLPFDVLGERAEVHARTGISLRTVSQPDYRSTEAPRKNAGLGKRCVQKSELQVSILAREIWARIVEAAARRKVDTAVKVGDCGGMKLTPGGGSMDQQSPQVILVRAEKLVPLSRSTCGRGQG
jgi:hypothetical protein